LKVLSCEPLNILREPGRQARASALLSSTREAN
jgi:hypothetical protein